MSWRRKLTTAIALIALGIGVVQWFPLGPGRTAWNKTGQPVTEPAIADSQLASVIPAPNTSDEPADSDKSAQSAAPVTVVSDGPDHKSTTLMVTPQQSDGGDSLAPSSINAEAVDPDGLIGRPFPVSESVAADCRNLLPKSHEAVPCGALLPELSEMAQEPRDRVWATDMEAKLRDFVLAQPNNFTVRLIECRLSLCAVEVASTYGGFPYVITYRSLRKKVSAWKGVHGFETDASGAKVTVTLFMVERL